MKNKILLFLFPCMLFVVPIIIFFYGIINGTTYYLEPKSPEGYQLYTKTIGFPSPSYSHVYIRYSLFSSKDTGIVFCEDDGPGLCGNNPDYIVTWKNNSRVSISFKGLDPDDYPDYITEEIEY